MHAMKTTTNPRRLITVPFSKTLCGVDFYINTGRSEEIRGVLTENPLFRTDFFEFFFLSRARGVLLLGSRRIELHDGMLLLLSPHQQQRWLVDETELDYTFLIFREDFMRTFLADKFFVYRLLYCYQTDTPPWFDAGPEAFAEYLRLLGKIKAELRAPTSDSYNLIVSVLYYLLVTLNRDYAAAYGLPVTLPRNNHAFRFKALLEEHIREVQRVEEYASMMRVSRVTLNRAVMEQFGVTAVAVRGAQRQPAGRSVRIFGSEPSDALLQAADRTHLLGLAGGLPARYSGVISGTPGSPVGRVNPQAGALTAQEAEIKYRFQKRIPHSAQAEKSYLCRKSRCPARPSPGPGNPGPLYLPVGSKQDNSHEKRDLRRHRHRFKCNPPAYQLHRNLRR